MPGALRAVQGSRQDNVYKGDGDCLTWDMTYQTASFHYPKIIFQTLFIQSLFFFVCIILQILQTQTVYIHIFLVTICQYFIYIF